MGRSVRLREGVTFVSAGALAVSLFLPWYWDGGPEFGGPRSAFQAGGDAMRLAALGALVGAFAAMSVVAVQFGERRTAGVAAPPALLLSLAAFAGALTVVLAFAPVAAEFPRGSIGQRPGELLGLVAAAAGLLATIPRRLSRRGVSAPRHA